MRPNSVALGLAVFAFSAAVFGAIVDEPRNDLECDFETHTKSGRLACHAFIEVCETSCRNAIDLDCDDGFDFTDNRNVRIEREDDLLRIFARREGTKVEIAVDDNFEARLLLSRHDGKRHARLRGECFSVPKPSPTPTPMPTFPPPGPTPTPTPGASAVTATQG